MRQLITHLCSIFLLVGVSSSTYAQTSNSTFLSTATTQTSRESTTKIRQKTFEVVWSTIQKKYYDATFSGLDWYKVRERYAPQVFAVKTDHELYALIKKMLDELHTSHLEIIPPEYMEQAASPPTTTGLGLRDVEGQVVVFRILPGSSAERAGLHQGFVVTKIDGKPVVNVDDAFGRLNGAPKTKVQLTVLDGQDAERDVSVERETLEPGVLDVNQIGKLSLYALFESKRLAGRIGYIRFTSFIEALNKKIHAAIESFHDAPGLIIDLRGNGGGDDSVAIKMAGMLFDKKTQLMITRTRKGDDFYYEARPQKGAFPGKVVILVDEASGSASEQIAAGMQEARRAIVIGKTTAGEDMDADMQKLPTGAYLVYAYGLPRTPKGVVIEGRGVIPDIEVSLSRAELLKGNDSQLAAAIEYIQRQEK